MNKDPIAAFQKKHIDKIIFLFATLGIAVTSLIIGMVVINDKASSIRNERTSRVQIMADLNALARLSDSKKQGDALLPSLQAALPGNLDIPVSVIPHVKALATARGLKIEFKLTEGQPAPFTDFAGLNFLLRAEGNMSAIANFVTDLENAKNVMSVSDWNVSRASTGVVDLTLTGLVYTRTIP